MKAFVADHAGVTAIEYALIGSLICLVILGGVTAIGGKLDIIFTNVSDGFQ